MNKRKQIAHHKLVNIIFILYLNSIVSILAIKQFDNDKTKNLNTILEKNLDDLLSFLNTSFHIHTKTYKGEDVSNSISLSIKPHNTTSYNQNMKKYNKTFSFTQASLLNSNLHNSTAELTNQWNTQNLNFTKLDDCISNKTTAQMRKILTHNEITVMINNTRNVTTAYPIPKLPQGNLTKLPIKTNNKAITNNTASNTTLSVATKNITLNKPLSRANAMVLPNNPEVKLSCPNNCTSKGICVNGECFCSQGFTSKDCSSTYKNNDGRGNKLRSNVKWLVAAFFIAFLITGAVLTWSFNKKAKAGDYLEL